MDRNKWYTKYMAMLLIFAISLSSAFCPVRTMAANSGEEQKYGEYLYSYGLLSDVHIGSSDYAEGNFRNALTYFQEQGIDLVSIVGDITEHSSTEELAQYKSIIDDYPDLDIYVSAGNHDATHGGINITNWRTYTGCELYFSFEKEGTDDVFVYMGQNKYTNVNPFTSQELAWLEETLERYKDKRVFFFEHIPLYDTVGNLKYNGSSLYPEVNFISMGNEQDLILRKLLKKYKNVIHFNGHTHWRYYLQKFNPDLNVYNGDGKYCYMVHVSSCGSPIDSDGTNRLSSDSARYGYSEGCKVDVYEHAIILNNMRFATAGEYVNELIEDAQYVITDEASLSKVEVTPATALLVPGGKKQFTAEVYSTGSADTSVTWSVDDDAGQISVDDSGMVTVGEDAEDGTYRIQAVSNYDNQIAGTAEIMVQGKEVLDGMVRIRPVADTFVGGYSTDRSKNYGTEEWMKLSQSSSSNDKKYGFLKFDLSDVDLEGVVAARLKLYYCGNTQNKTADTDICVFDAGNSTWEENQITWDNMDTKLYSNYVDGKEIRNSLAASLQTVIFGSSASKSTMLEELQCVAKGSPMKYYKGENHGIQTLVYDIKDILKPDEDGKFSFGLTSSYTATLDPCILTIEGAQYLLEGGYSTLDYTPVLEIYSKDPNDIKPEGSKENPYLIETEEDFLVLTQKMNDGENLSGVYYKQTADLDMSEYTGYEGVYQYNSSSGDGYFGGTYDGYGHTIKVSIESSKGNISVFGNITGTVTNLGITGTIVSTHSGGSGYPAAFARAVRAGGTLSNCWSDAFIQAYQPGGIVRTNYGTMKNCYFSGNVKAGKDAVIVAMGETGAYQNCYYYLEESIANMAVGNQGTQIMDETELQSAASNMNRDINKDEAFWYVNSGNALTFAGFKGDVNRDDSVDIADVQMTLSAASRQILLSDKEKVLADINTDNKVTAIDALLILKQVIS